MKITFSEKFPPPVSGAIYVSFVEAEQDEVMREEGVLTLKLGMGKKGELTLRKFPLLVRKAVSIAKNHKATKMIFSFPPAVPKNLKISNEMLAETVAFNLNLANYKFVKCRTEPKEGWGFIDEIIMAGKVSAKVKKSFEKGEEIGRAVNATRDMANTPGGDMTPKVLADAAKKVAQGTKVSVKILDKKEMEKLGMGAVLGVAKGSTEEPKFIVLEYWGGKKNDAPIALVGKGVTFDSGGVNIKTGDYMLGMNMDMSGGAAVIQTTVLLARLGIKKNIVALVPAVENMPSGSSYRPGDVLKSMSGKTIEIRNTDAEGRVILADALTYAVRYKPKVVIDVATLTGAAVVALGERASALFTKSDKLAEALTEAGEETNEYIWRMPLWDEYEADIKGEVGDVTNTHNKNSRYGGAINGAMFLYQFAKNHPWDWAHIDIAPRME
ncbi:MAG: leucyl aminopeptidase, partial [Patescibacteria group bacterium]